MIAAVRYVALNPVRARLVAKARDWPHSSARAHLKGRDDGLVRVRPVLDRVARFADLLDTQADDAAFAALRRSEWIGRPLGSESFTKRAEALLGRTLSPAKRGPKRKTQTPAPKRG